MKLHLPVKLLTALLAVMVVVPSYASVSLKKNGVAVVDWDGKLTGMHSGEDIEIVVDCNGDPKAAECVGNSSSNYTQDGKTAITVTGEGASFTAKSLGSAGPILGYAAGDNSFVEVKLEEGGTFNLYRADLGKVGKFSAKSGYKATVQIDISGGSKFNMELPEEQRTGASSIGCFDNVSLGYSGSSETTINVTGQNSVFRHVGGNIGSSYYKSSSPTGTQKMKTEIKVSEGGRYDFSATDKNSGFIGYVAGNQSDATVNISVDGVGSVFDMHAEDSNPCKIGYVSDGSGNTSHTTINVTDGGEFQMTSKEPSAQAAEIGGCEIADGTAEVTINVNGNADGDKSTFSVLKKCMIGKATKGTATVKINVGQGGFFRATNLYAGLAETAGADAKTDVNISLTGNGEMELNGGCVGMVDEGLYPAGTKASTVVDLTIADNGIFTLSGSTNIGYAEGTVDAGSEVTVLVKNHGTLNLNAGSVGDRKGKTPGSTSLAITLQDDAQMMWGKSAKIGNETTETKIVLQGNSTLTRASANALRGTVAIHDGATYDMGGNGSNDSGSITLYGGGLQNAGSYRGDVSVNTDVGFSGGIDMGGLDASLLTSVKLNQTGTYLTNLGEGTTLTLHVGDVVKIDETNAFRKGQMPENAQAVFQFGEDKAMGAGKGTVDVEEDAKLVLGLDGQYVLSQEDEYGRLELSIWITNGQLQGAVEGDPTGWFLKHFAVQTGWDLKVRSYDIETGMLVLVGGANVWDAVEDGDDQTGHHQANGNVGELQEFDRVIIDEDTTLKADEDATLQQVEGANGSTLHFVKDGGDDTTITLNYADTDDVDGTGDTQFQGNIEADAGVNLEKTGDAALSVEGNLKTEGNVTVKEGALNLGRESDSSIGGDLAIGGGDTQADMQVDGKLGVTGDVAVENGKLSFSGESEGSIGGNLKLGDKGNGTTGDVQVDKKLDVAGDVSVEKGTLTFGENSSGTLGGLSLSEDGNMQVGGQLDVTGDVKVEKGTLSFGEKSEGSIGGELSLSEGGNLQVDGQLTLSGGVAEGGKGSVRGSGTVTLDGEDSAFGNDVELDEHLTFKMGEHAKRADFGQNDVTLRDLSGDKDVTAHSVDMTGEGDFSGTIHGDVDVHGKYNLSGARVHGDLDVGGTDVESTAKGDVTLDEAQQHLTVDGDVILRDGATTRIRLNFGDEAEWRESQHDSIVLETAKNIIVEKGTIIEIENLGEAVTSNMKRGDKEVILMDAKHVYTCDHHYDEATEREQLHDTESVGTEHGARAEARLDGALNWLFKKAEIVFYNGKQANEQQIMLTASGEETEQPQHDAYVAAVFEMRSVEDLDAVTKSTNATAAGRLLWHYTENKSMAEMDPAVNDLIEYLGDMLATNPDKVRRAMTALAGSTLTSLSAAQYAEHRWQMGRVRDHALMAGNLRCAEYNPDASRVGACRTTQVWAEGTSFYSEQHSRGDESGYRLNSWGGAVGMDVQMRSNWSVGLALAANYGDLEAYTIDRAKGDFDSYYMSAWSQAKNGRWGNTLVATFGVSDASLKRTFETCAAKSTSSGSSLGAMWELTYDLYPDKENHRQILQPLFSVAVSHTSMDAFSETGIGSLGLHADKQTRDTVTLGLGARWLAAIETGKAANRTISTELRMNVAQDLGDRRSTADVALLADPTYTQTVRGARAGTTAFQIGAGINVPVTRYTQLYFNAGGDLRTHVATWNGALGVRIGF